MLSLRSPSRSTWEDLPPEVFEHTLTYPDEASLLTLAQLNRFFNYVALERFFGKAMMKTLRTESKISNPPDGGGVRDNVAEGLRLALWLQNLEHIHYYVSKETFISELKSLQKVVSRQQGLKTFHIDLKEAKIWYISADIEENLAALCDVAIEKGCDVLKLSRLEVFMRCPPKATPAIEGSSTPRNLRSLRICGALLYVPITIYGFNLLQKHSQTIRYLHFDPSTSFVGRDVWIHVLEFYLFPSLETFQFENLVVTQALPKSLVRFLSHQPTIKKLRVSFGLCRRTNPFESLEQPALPNLSLVDAESSFIAWLFRNPDVCPNVQKVIINQGEANGRFLDEALQVVAGSTRSPPESIVLRVCLYSPFWSAWMMRHIEDEFEDEESGLRDVRIVRLSFRVDSTTVEMDAEAMQCFARWIALFPTLRHLEIQRPSDNDVVDVASGERKLYDVVFRHCPNLESFSFVPWDDDGFGE
ncbi:hypothetical protein AN958_08612 [Leucoagaricus sp. SymC.cos]|nr:hypothetical protein AN958_08612 [Leucoagaricus sp. SymC.cos]